MRFVLSYLWALGMMYLTFSFINWDWTWLANAGSWSKGDRMGLLVVVLIFVPLITLVSTWMSNILKRWLEDD